MRVPKDVWKIIASKIKTPSHSPQDWNTFARICKHTSSIAKNMRNQRAIEFNIDVDYFKLHQKIKKAKIHLKSKSEKIQQKSFWKHKWNLFQHKILSVSNGNSSYAMIRFPITSIRADPHIFNSFLKDNIETLLDVKISKYHRNVCELCFKSSDYKILLYICNFKTNISLYNGGLNNKCYYHGYFIIIHEKSFAKKLCKRIVRKTIKGHNFKLLYRYKTIWDHIYKPSIKKIAHNFNIKFSKNGKATFSLKI